MREAKRKLLHFTGISNEVLELIRFELNMWLVRLNSNYNPLRASKISKYCRQTNINLNIGAGPFGEDGWVNIDMFKYKNISFTYDCRKKLPFKNNTVLNIRCEHLLEHMDRKFEATFFLRECFRVLTKGGVVRIIVPDIEKFIKAYYEKDWKSVGIEYNMTNEWQEADILTLIFRQDGEHKFGYDFKALSTLLEESGFKNIQKMKFGYSNSTELTKDQDNHKYHSLYVEAIK